MAGGYNLNDRNNQNNSRLYGSDPDFLFESFAAGIAKALMNDIRAIAGDQISSQLLYRLGVGLNIFLGQLYKDVDNKKFLEELHEQLAKEVQEEIVRAFEKSGIGKKRPSYRYNDKFKLRRFANKRLKRALNDPRFITYSHIGIKFPNTDLLDNDNEGKAPQWYKLNFGASPKSTPPKNGKNMTWGDRSTNTNVNLNKFGPSKEFYVPETTQGGRGYWSERFTDKTPRNVKWYVGRKYSGNASRGSGALYIIGRKWAPLGFEKKLSKGIVGARFLDAGTKYFNDNYGVRLGQMFNQWFRDAAALGKIEANKKVRTRMKTDIVVSGPPGGRSARVRTSGSANTPIDASEALSIVNERAAARKELRRRQLAAKNAKKELGP